jgi:hypothetical protein
VFAAPGQISATYGNQVVQRALRSRLWLQTKLTVNEPGDAYEREADQVAETVMRMSDTPLQRACADCEREQEEQLHREPAGPDRGRPEVTPGLESRIAALHGGGSPLTSDIRKSVEPRFGSGFGHVRIHTGSSAASLAREVNARAFTVGHNIVFGQGEFLPRTPGGLRLLAHELTHVVQQGETVDGLPPESESEPSAETSLMFGQARDQDTRSV